MVMNFGSDSALLIVDVQNDFCPGGALAVAGGDRVVGPLNRLAEQCAAQGIAVLASRDWHPLRTRHFREYGGAWPPHCVQDTAVAAFHPGLRLPAGGVVLSKGIDPEEDSYSAFDAVTDDGRPLAALLKELGVHRLLIGGLATDYCVRASVLDALKAGLAVIVLTDAVAGVDLVPGDSERAMAEMAGAGARFCRVEALLQGQEGSGFSVTSNL